MNDNKIDRINWDKTVNCNCKFRVVGLIGNETTLGGTPLC